ncbi:hypothetical protein [Nonomuraea sp. NPDC049400]|uniref:hypothetical protein n=1 Tax=Nonomuraea sp. NPDC049400 TaxID=3364352 RepID=UPI0037AEB04F
MSAFCEHNRLADHCEDCALIQAKERGYRPPEHPQAPATPEPEIAEQTVLIETGLNTYTLVMAGDDIPHSLRNLPRRDRDTMKLLKPKRST